jgi:DNA-binding response OmpR family regulator
MKKRVLVVEDDPSLGRAIGDNLRLDGYDVECAADGATALASAKAFSPDLVVLDLMLPDRDGFDLCERWRQEEIPVIILSARGQREDKLRGLALGADDYVTKPFDLEELLARIRVVLRRTDPGLSKLILGPVTIDLVTRAAWRSGTPMELTGREYEVLRYLASRPDRVVRREELLRNVWGYTESPVNSRAVDHAIARLRRKIEPDVHRHQFLHTVYGDGYCLTPKG